MTRVRHIGRIVSWTPWLVLLCSAAGAQTVSMIAHITTPTTSSFTVDVHLDTDLQDVQGVEIELTFDETVVRLDAITAGDWFTSSGMEYFFWDYTTPGIDVIHFSGAILHEGRTVDGVIGVCHFTALVGGICPLDFVDVDVRDSVNQDLGAAHSTGDQIIINEAIANERFGLGEIKALYR